MVRVTTLSLILVKITMDLAMIHVHIAFPFYLLVRAFNVLSIMDFLFA